MLTSGLVKHQNVQGKGNPVLSCFTHTPLYLFKYIYISHGTLDSLKKIQYPMMMTVVSWLNTTDENLKYPLFSSLWLSSTGGCVSYVYVCVYITMIYYAYYNIKYYVSCILESGVSIEARFVLANRTSTDSMHNYYQPLYTT